MVAVSKLPPPSYASPIEEAQALVRQCAEPRPAGDQVKAAILRASRGLGLPFNRTKDIWYGDVRRIDAEEMDRLRQVAEKTELAHAVAAIEVLKNRMLASCSSASRQVVAALNATLRALGSDQENRALSQSLSIVSRGPDSGAKSGPTAAGAGEDAAEILRSTGNRDVS